MLDRRVFLKVTAALAAASALDTVPAFAQADGGQAVPLTAPMQPPGMYQISGRVRLQDPFVEISGITNAHQISWSPGSLSEPVATFTSFEEFDRPWRLPSVQVRGGQLESLAVVPINFV
jgi:hypothetical protein